MPPRRASRKRGATPRTYCRKTNYSSFASRVRKIVEKQAETKYLIRHATASTVYGSTLTSPAVTSVLNNIAEGFTENTRVGNKIAPMMINLRGSLRSNSLKPIISRILVVESNASDDPRMDLLEDNAGALAPPAQDLYAISSRINTSKYRVLKQINLFTGTYANHTGDYGSTQLFNETIKLRGVMEYADGTTTCPKRTIHLVPIYRDAGNDGGISGGIVELTWNSKFYYKDI